MDLENYKKVWSNQSEETNKLSSIEIYKLAHSKSSSIVKWIFIIGILEFVIFNSVYFFFDMEEANNSYKELGLENFIYYSQILTYIILFYFLVVFYKNYKNISVIDTTKTLMDKILKTRKTVRNYVFFNLSYLVFISIVVTSAMVNEEFANDSSKKVFVIILTMLITTTVLVGIFWLFYQLLYGILLKKLNRNYKELAKLDDLN